MRLWPARPLACVGSLFIFPKSRFSLANIDVFYFAKLNILNEILTKKNKINIIKEKRYILNVKTFNCLKSYCFAFKREKKRKVSPGIKLLGLSRESVIELWSAAAIKRKDGDEGMKNRIFKIAHGVLALALLVVVMISATAKVDYAVSPEKERLMMAEVERIQQGDTDGVLHREEDVWEADGVRTLMEDVFTKDYRIILTRSDQGYSAVIEDFANGMGYEIIDGQITDSYDLNEIREIM